MERHRIEHFLAKQQLYYVKCDAENKKIEDQKSLLPPSTKKTSCSELVGGVCGPLFLLVMVCWVWKLLFEDLYLAFLRYKIDESVSKLGSEQIKQCFMEWKIQWVNKARQILISKIVGSLSWLFFMIIIAFDQHKGILWLLCMIGILQSLYYLRVDKPPKKEREAFENLQKQWLTYKAL